MTFCLVLAIVIWRSSSGCLRASRTWCENSGSSSRKRTPWCAREISPGIIGVPPPIIEQAELLWWGERRGRILIEFRVLDNSLSLVISSSSFGVGGGRRDGIALARSVLPLPGGPLKRILWWPARARTRARLAKLRPWIWSIVTLNCWECATIDDWYVEELIEIIDVWFLRWRKTCWRLLTG